MLLILVNVKQNLSADGGCMKFLVYRKVADFWCVCMGTVIGGTYVTFKNMVPTVSEEKIWKRNITSEPFCTLKPKNQMLVCDAGSSGNNWLAAVLLQ